MKVYCVCVESTIDEGDEFRVEIFSTLENATLYLDSITDGGSNELVRGDVVEYELDNPESGDTCFIVEDSDYSTSSEYSSDESESD